ncbi:L-arabinose transport system permease protein AraQ [compost metagenome]
MKKALAYLVLILGAVSMAMPFGLMLVTSLMSNAQAMAYPPRLWPDPVAWENYAKALTATPLWRYFLNSALVSSVTVLGQVVTGAMAAYAFARLRFKGRDALFLVFLATMMVPPQVNVVPLFGLMCRLGWVNTYWALIVPGLFGAFGVFLLRQWFLSFPAELEEAAKLDGCTPWGTFWRIAFPTAVPAIATLAIFAFITSWNSFFWPLIVTNSDALRTLPVGLAAYRASFREITDWGTLMAATTLAILPAIGVFLAGQRYFIQGMLAGSLKD